jgi:DNA-binding beta-propeller fold protein YncE
MELRRIPESAEIGSPQPGDAAGEFSNPFGICFTADGNLVVADEGNNRVQILKPDGTFVRAFGSSETGQVLLHSPSHVSAGPDGIIAVLDQRRDRVQIFDGEGRFVRSVMLGLETDRERNGVRFCLGGGGEIVLFLIFLEEIRVLNREGELLQIIGKGGDSMVDWAGETADIAVNADGRIAVAVHTGFSPASSDILFLS